MTGGDRGFTFSTWEIFPRMRELDRALSIDGIAMISIIEESCFWLFLGWLDKGRWPAFTDATIAYRQRIGRADAPLRIDGWLVTQSDVFDVTLAYEVRREAEPGSDPVFTAQIRWQALEIGSLEGLNWRDAGRDEFRSSTGTLT